MSPAAKRSSADAYAAVLNCSLASLIKGESGKLSTNFLSAPIFAVGSCRAVAFSNSVLSSRGFFWGLAVEVAAGRRTGEGFFGGCPIAGITIRPKNNEKIKTLIKQHIPPSGPPLDRSYTERISSNLNMKLHLARDGSILVT